MVATSEHCDFWRVSNIAEILKGTEPGPSFSQLVYESISAFKGLSIISQAQKKKTIPGQEWICDPFVNKSGEST